MTTYLQQSVKAKPDTPCQWIYESPLRGMQSTVNIHNLHTPAQNGTMKYYYHQDLINIAEERYDPETFKIHFYNTCL